MKHRRTLLQDALALPLATEMPEDHLRHELTERALEEGAEFGVAPILYEMYLQMALPSMRASVDKLDRSNASQFAPGRVGRRPNSIEHDALILAAFHAQIKRNIDPLTRTRLTRAECYKRTGDRLGITGGMVRKAVRRRTANPLTDIQLSLAYARLAMAEKQRRDVRLATRPHSVLELRKTRSISAN